MNICGIDPGLTKGGIIILSPQRVVLHKYAMPREIQDIQNLFSTFPDCEVYLELIRGFAGTSKLSMTKMMEHYGVLQASLVCAGIQYTCVPPQTWQKEIWISADMVYEGFTKSGKPKTDTKATSLNSAERLFPNEDLRYGDNEKKGKGKERGLMHQGLMDAVLIAEYGIRKTK